MFKAKNEKSFISYAPWNYSPKKQPNGKLSSKEAERNIKKAMKKGHHSFEWVHQRLDGEKFLATVLLVKMKISGKYLLQATVRDITRQKEAEQKVMELNDLRNKFITIISHQLRTPLNAIRWNLETLLEGQMGKLRKPQIEFLKIVYKANIEMIRRLNELLVVIDIEEGRVVTNLLNTSIEDIWDSLKNEFKEKSKTKKITFNYQKPKKSLPIIKVDPVKIGSVITTIMRNAIDYTEEKGKVDTKLELTDGNIRFSVHDSGIGIPKTEQSKVFSRFFRGSNAFKMVTDASGVGLSIAKFYVEQHSGKIGFKSKEGKGSTFWFEIPIK